MAVSTVRVQERVVVVDEQTRMKMRSEEGIVFVLLAS